MANDHCPFCNLTVAPADPSAVSHGSVRAHGRCIVSTVDQLTRLVRISHVFIGSLGLPDVLDFWHDQLTDRRVYSRETLIPVLRSCLRKIDDWRLRYGEEGPYTYPQTVYVDAFRQHMGELLLCQL